MRGHICNSCCKSKTERFKFSHHQISIQEDLLSMTLYSLNLNYGKLNVRKMLYFFNLKLKKINPIKTKLIKINNKQ